MGKNELPAKVKLPDEVIDKLIQLASDLDNNCWELGDICLALVDELSTIYPKHEIRSAIANESGLAIDTLRDRERVSRRITNGDRKYPFTYHQYRACLAAGNRWQEYAEWCLDSMEEYGGRIPPVAVIRMKIKGENAEEQRWVKLWEKIQEIAERLLTDEQTPEVVRSVVRLVADTKYQAS